MSFDSAVYIVFLALVVAAYWRLPFRSQNLFLLGASYFFYGWWDYRFLLLMIGSTAMDYVIGRQISRSQNSRRRKSLLISSLVVNFSILGFFKYSNFFLDSLLRAMSAAGFHHLPIAFLKVILPPGISFYTFQEIAYIVDVYKHKIQPAESIIDYALFISLFPHLIAGPIQRPDHLLPQVQRPRLWNPEMAFDGLLLILEGLFRKCVVADQCALVANAVFSGRLGPPSLAVTLLGMWAFAFQIYGDFSGYSSIARGSAQFMGFHFMVNFRQPYFARNFQDFWRRWHMSLSTWLRDYLYIPLGGNRHGTRKTYRNLMLTMLLGGLWHGANWTFVIWGGLHGAGLAIEKIIANSAHSRFRIPGWLKRVLVFQLVCIAWIFFRASSFRSAIAFLTGFATWHWSPAYRAALELLGTFSIPLILVDLWLEWTGDEYFLQSRSFSPRVAYALATSFATILFSANQTNAFIYFQF